MSAPYQWRAEAGYISAAPPPAHGMVVLQAVPCLVQVPQHPIQDIPAPVGISGIFTKIEKRAEKKPSPPPGQTAIPPPPPKPEPEPKKASKTDNSKPPSNPRAPPPLIPGTNYMFPMQTLLLHVFTKAASVWKPKYQSEQLHFKIYQVDTQKTVKAMIEYVLDIKKPEDCGQCKGWAATEVYEQGDRTFLKGTTIEYGSGKASGTFSSMGWNAERGKSLPPVWVTVHKPKA
ncbi:hypothetical protein BAUCODRAFT_511790 [Baudoinia panamericana UAMH 10762]|uniref:Uncharacterized protein n=1 Tax=Baudoinia panamericana (strain UAMH 10762) TaxID=717646 RepID=M2MWT2_BAUPA|nr:uncharacterized protein BAUCODRAFT_511790 [Baudoinia panamericana UAMH 10762]EMC95988.1 hypothetical protein BAUCODRAFT_511790 [Baudoinia panamericana UAMH 10762]